MAKKLAISILAVGVLCGALTVYLEADAASPRGTPHANDTSFAIPRAMKAEHEELHAALAELTRAGGETGEAARAVAKVLDPHFTKENEYALPPLGLLVRLSEGKFDCSMTGVLEMTEKLRAEMPTMKAEHADITAALQTLRAAATAENKAAGVEFADHLTAHAQTEEEITYPTALLIGSYVKSKAAPCGR